MTMAVGRTVSPWISFGSVEARRRGATRSKTWSCARRGLGAALRRRRYFEIEPDATREEGVVIACHDSGAFDVRLDDGALLEKRTTEQWEPLLVLRYEKGHDQRVVSMDQLRFLRPRFLDASTLKAPPEHAAFVSETDLKRCCSTRGCGIRDPGAAGEAREPHSCVLVLARRRRDVADPAGRGASRFSLVPMITISGVREDPRAILSGCRRLVSRLPSEMRSYNSSQKVTFAGTTRPLTDAPPADAHQ